MIKFALAGNPNCGKTTLFNSLTGSTAHVGNWPGVTVERREGTHRGLAEPITIVDLPGIYSLSPFTPEEIVTRNFIIDENPEIVINIVDASNLERNLYLTTQLLESDRTVVIAINMMDILQKNGDELDIEMLEKQFGVPVISISALHSTNIKELVKRASELVNVERTGTSIVEDSHLAPYIEEMKDILRQDGQSDSLSFHSVKLLEKDQLEVKRLENSLVKKAEEIAAKVGFDPIFDGDISAVVADIRYKYIENKCMKALKPAKKDNDLTTSDKIDKVMTHPLFGIPIFLLCMFGVFHVTFGSNFLFFTGLPTPGVFLQELTGTLMGIVIDSISNALTYLNASNFAYGLIVYGLLAGIDGVLSFIPQILLLFLFLSILEDTGYMARAAFMMDRLFTKFGLSGRAFMPMLMGFGCSVPAIMATRTMQQEKDRRMTIMLMTGFSCGAKLPIWSLFALALFPESADLMVFGIYILGIFTAMISAFLLKNTLFKGESSPFILELPAYHMPQAQSVIIHLWEKLKGYIIRAGTIIAASAIVIWFLASFSLQIVEPNSSDSILNIFNFSLQMVEPNSADSILGVLGTFLVPLFKPLGWASGPDGWKAVVATLTGLIAKEVVVTSMGVLYNPGVEADALEDETAYSALIPVIVATFSIPAALSFMAFNLLSVPCMAAVGAARAELRSVKWFWGTIIFWLALAYVVSFITYNVGTLLGF